jgi:hypothetical protein
MMHLGDEGEVPVLQPLDDVHLPERLRTVELATADVADELGELVHATGRRQSSSSQVEVDVEGRVVHPVRVSQAEGDLYEPAPEHGSLDEAAAHEFADAIERIATFDGGRIEYRCHRHMHVQGRRLQVEEAGV